MNKRILFAHLLILIDTIFQLKKKYCGNSKNGKPHSLATMYYTHTHTYIATDKKMYASSFQQYLLHNKKVASNWRKNGNIFEWKIMKRRKALHYDEIFHRKRVREMYLFFFEKQPNIKERLTNTETAILPQRVFN